MTVEIISANVLIPYQINPDKELEKTRIRIDDLRKSFSPRLLRRLTRIDKLFLQSTQRALAQNMEWFGNRKLNYFMTTSYGELQGNLKYMALLNQNMVSPTTFIQTISNSIMGNVAMLMKFKGNCVAFSCSNVIRAAMACMANEDVYVVSGGDEQQEEVKSFSHVNEGMGSLVLKASSSRHSNSIYIDQSLSISNFWKKKNRLDKLLAEVPKSSVMVILLNDEDSKSYLLEKLQQNELAFLDLSDFVGTYYGGNSIIATALAYELLNGSLCIEGFSVVSSLTVITNEKSGPLIINQLSKGVFTDEAR